MKVGQYHGWQPPDSCSTLRAQASRRTTDVWDQELGPQMRRVEAGPRRTLRPPSSGDIGLYSLNSTAAGGAGDLGPGFVSVHGRQTPGGSSHT